MTNDTISGKFAFARGARTNLPRGGFTLIELLIAIGIIGILGMMILPALVGARRQARYSVCENNLRQVGGAIHAYINYTDGIMPLGNEAVISAQRLMQPTNLISLNDPACRWNGPTGLGILISKGYIDDGHILYQSGNITCTELELDKFSPGASHVRGGVESQYFYLHGGLGRGTDLPRLHPAKALVMDWQGYALVGGEKTAVTHNHDGTACHFLRADGSVSQYVPESKDTLLDNLNCVSDPRGAFDFADAVHH